MKQIILTFKGITKDRLRNIEWEAEELHPFVFGRNIWQQDGVWHSCRRMITPLRPHTLHVGYDLILQGSLNLFSNE